MKKIILFLTIVVLCGCATTNELLIKEGNEIKSVNQEQVLRKVKECQEEVTPPRRGSPGWGHYYGRVQRKNEVCRRELSPIYNWYNDRLSREVLKNDDPKSLEQAYKEWEAKKDLQVIHELTVYYSGSDRSGLLRSHIEESNIKLSKERKDIKQLRATYWKLGFVKGPGQAAWVENMISVGIKEIDKSEAEERRKRELEIAEQKRREAEERKRQDEIAARKAKEKTDAEFAMAHPDLSTVPGVAGNLPSNKTPKTRAALSFGGTWWHNKNGFGDLKWGADLGKLLGQKDSLGRTTKRNGNAEYTRTGDGLRYYFYNGKFYSVGMISYMPAQRMFTDLVEDYGRPTNTGGGLGFQTAEWNVGNVKVLLKGGSVGFTVYWMYTPIAAKAAIALK
jgi:hypothetical protein